MPCATTRSDLGFVCTWFSSSYKPNVEYAVEQLRRARARLSQSDFGLVKMVLIRRKSRMREIRFVCCSNKSKDDEERNTH